MKPSGSSWAGDMWNDIPTPCSADSAAAAFHSGSEHVVWPTRIDHAPMRPPGGPAWCVSWCCRWAIASSVVWRYTAGSGGRSQTQRPTRPRIPTSSSPSTTSSRKRIVPASRNVVVPVRSISTAASWPEIRSSAASNVA